MNKFKTRYISDNIHGSIPFSSLIEKSILADPLFNRLQGIKQNSTAYKTYPSLENSRFSHSLGVMHLASQIFYNSILNGDNETVKLFIGSFKNYLYSVIKSTKSILTISSFLDHMFVRLGHKVTEVSSELLQIKISNVSENKIDIFSKYFDNDNIFSSCNIDYLDDEERNVFFILLQAIRLCALFHDLGHPPFSHAIEFAVQDFHRKNLTKENEVGIDQKDFFRIIHYYRYALDEMGFAELKPFHESVSIIFIQNILNNLIASSWENDVNKNDNDRILFIFYLFIIRSMTLSINLGVPLQLDENGMLIFNDKVGNAAFNNLADSFLALKRIISDDIDADRLDYVMRDGQNSGFSAHTFNLSRIISNFTLCKENEDYHFLTSIRSLNDTEKFLRERLAIYRYIVFHHNVVKTDLILSKIIEYVFRLSIFGDNSEHYKHWKYFWGYLDTKDLRNFDLTKLEKFIMKASAWNEHWLISAMNISYQILHKKNLECLGRESSLPATELKLYLLLKEFLYNGRNLFSLWKRHLSFMQYVNTFVPFALINRDHILKSVDLFIKDQESLEPKFSLVSFRNKRKQLSKIFTTLFDELKNNELKNSVELENNYEHIREKTKLLKVILQVLTFMDKDIEENLEKKISENLNANYNSEFMVFIKIIEARLKPGVSENCLIGTVKDHEQNVTSVEKLKNVSSIIGELEEAALYSPLFHIFISEICDSKLTKPLKIEHTNLADIYKIVINCMLNEFKI